MLYIVYLLQPAVLLPKHSFQEQFVVPCALVVSTDLIEDLSTQTKTRNMYDVGFFLSELSKAAASVLLYL